MLRYIPFLQFLVAFVAGTFSIPPTTEPPHGSLDLHMLQFATRIQSTSHSNPFTTPFKIHPFHIVRPIEHFRDRALYIAQTSGAKFVGDYHRQDGRTVRYFYSAIHPSDVLGRDLGLEEDQVASVLWKFYTPSVEESEVVHVGVWAKRFGERWWLDEFGDAGRIRV